MIRRNIGRIALLATAVLVAISSPVAAGQWSPRTTLTFSEPVKVPGTTLPAGTYVFELVNPNSDVVKISDSAGSKVYALASVVPVIRPERTEDVILLFTPMDRGAMPAIRGWYPPGGRYGHLFLYSKEEARSLADRTKSVVLSRDIDDSSMEAGTIVVFRPGGERSPWTQDANTQREWDTWIHTGPDRGAPASQVEREHPESMTPMVADTPRGQPAKIDDVEDHPEQYFGKTLSLDGKIDEVYGPHLFELDEPDWGQPEGDVLVFLPEGTLAAVRENDRVTVTGTLKRLIRSDLIREARWLDVDGITNRSLDQEPVLVATRVVGGDDNRAMVLGSTASPAMMTPAGTSAPITDAAVVGSGNLALVGRRVALPAVTIHSLDRDDGFFVKSGDRSLFVLVNNPDEMKFRTGDSVILEGVVLALPPTLAAGLKMPAEANAHIYVYARSLRSARSGAPSSVHAASGPPARQTTHQTAERQQTMTITAGELADRPDRYYGKHVKITGEVEDVYSRSVFAIDEDRFWSTGRDVLVLNPNAVARVNEDRSVTVQGIVRPFSYTDVDTYISWQGWQWDLARVYETRFAKRPVVIADSIMASNNRELVMQGDRIRSSAAEYGKPAIGKPVVVLGDVIYTTPEDLSQHPEKYYGKSVSIFGDAEDTFGTRLFSIDEDRLWSTGQDVLVLAQGVDPGWKDLAYVQVRGKVMRFSKDEVQKRIDKDRTIATRFWADFADRPIIIAESITGPDGRDLMKGTGTPLRR